MLFIVDPGVLETCVTFVNPGCVAPSRLLSITRLKSRSAEPYNTLRLNRVAHTSLTQIAQNVHQEQKRCQENCRDRESRAKSGGKINSSWFVDPTLCPAKPSLVDMIAAYCLMQPNGGPCPH